MDVETRARAIAAVLAHPALRHVDFEYRGSRINGERMREALERMPGGSPTPTEGDPPPREAKAAVIHEMIHALQDLDYQRLNVLRWEAEAVACLCHNVYRYFELAYDWDIDVGSETALSLHFSHYSARLEGMSAAAVKVARRIGGLQPKLRTLTVTADDLEPMRVELVSNEAYRPHAESRFPANGLGKAMCSHANPHAASHSGVYKKNPVWPGLY